LKFGPVPVADTKGAVLAHAVTLDGQRLRKAHVITAGDIEALAAAGFGEVIVARLEPGDLSEDEAATRLATVVGADNIEVKAVGTGRVNLYAAAAGVFRVEARLVDAINAVDPAITLATLADFSSVRHGQMVATVKIIPFGVSAALVERAVASAADGEAIRVSAFVPKRVGVIQTTLPGLKASTLDKTRDVTAARLARMGSAIVSETRVTHRAGALAEALKAAQVAADMIVIFGASAVSDPDDVIPAAIRCAGGGLERVGMPVDPGNLIVLGHLGEAAVIGAPGSARSPKLNGFDWVLERLCADIDVSGGDIARMGVGGLLTEIPSRPQPREGKNVRPLRIGSLLLAAGRSSRMRGANKLLASFDGEPLIRRSAQRLAAASAEPPVVVLGNRAAEMKRLLDGLPLTIADNPDFESGLASSLKAGIRALPPGLDGVLIALADMPNVTPDDFRRLIDMFRRHEGRAVIRASAGEFRGNPVILPKALVARIDELHGDTGARHLIEDGGLEIVDVDIGEAARIDVDTPEALAAAGGILEPAIR